MAAHPTGGASHAARRGAPLLASPSGRFRRTGSVRARTTSSGSSVPEVRNLTAAPARKHVGQLRADVQSYWTAERMRDARPADRVLGAKGARSFKAAFPFSSH